LRLVRIYYCVVEALGALLGKHMPVLAAWSERERAICARYAAVEVGRRLQASLEFAASLRGC
jgi:hypothetical protein